MRIRALWSMGSFWRVIREFNPEGIEREANAPLSLWIVGEPGAGKRTLASSILAGGSAAGYGPFSILDLRADPASASVPAGADLIVLVQRMDAEMAEAGRSLSALVLPRNTPTLLVFTHGDMVESGREQRNAAFRAFSYISHLRTVFLDPRNPRDVQLGLVPLILESLPSLRMPLARVLPVAREQVAREIIAETCKVNAQFALASNLPANLPLIGGVAGNVADFLVLTKNQIMMVFRLAALHGRDISLTRSIALEIAPVIAGAFAWRTAARLAVGMLPTILAAAPKMAIAYVGTYVVGQAASFYYAEGKKPPRAAISAFSEEGARLFESSLRPLLDRVRDTRRRGR